MTVTVCMPAANEVSRDIFPPSGFRVFDDATGGELNDIASASITARADDYLSVTLTIPISRVVGTHEMEALA